MGGQSRHQHYAHDWTVGVQAPALASASAGEGPKSRRRTVRRSPRPSATPPRLARAPAARELRQGPPPVLQRDYAGSWEPGGALRTTSQQAEGHATVHPWRRSRAL